MRRQAKAPSAFTHGRSTLAAILALALLASLAFAPAAFAGKFVDRVVAGSTAPGTSEGLLAIPRGIAVNYANVADGNTDPLGNSTDGYVYVVDERLVAQPNNRIQVFSPDGTFRFMWGRGVQSGSDGAEVCDSSEVPCTSTTEDNEEGELTRPDGIAINQQTGDVYVRDRVNLRVQQFAADGTFIRTWGWDVATEASPDNTGTGFEICASLCKAGSSGGGGGQLLSGSAGGPIAVVPAGAPNAGNVIVADAGNRRLQEFGPGGGFIRAWGWDVVQPGGSGDSPTPAFEICTVSTQCKAGASLTSPQPDGAFGASRPDHVVVDSAGVVYASDVAASSAGGSPNRVQRFDSTKASGAELLRPSIDVVTLAGRADISSGLNQTDALAIDPSSGNLFVAFSGNNSFPELRVVSEFANPAGSPVEVDSHLLGANLAPNGMAFDHAGDDLYFTSSTSGQRLFAADDDGAPPPNVFIGNAQNVEADSATVGGCVDPAGVSALPASYRFQYSKDGVNWTDVGSFIDLGTAPIDCGDPGNQLEAPLAGLEANTLYRFRILTKRGFGNPEAPSPEGTFSTDAITPTVTTVPPANRADTSALLAGRVNPNGSATTYRFEWGKTTSYNKLAPFPDANAGSGGVARDVVQQISGLEPATTYHYRLCAESAQGVSCGDDQAFFTRPAFAGFAARGYEQVTPGGALRDSGAIYIGIRDALTAAATDGEAIAYAASAITPDDNFGTVAVSSTNTVISRRSPESWTTKAAGPRPHSVTLTGASIIDLPRLDFLNSESNRAVVTTNAGWFGDPEPKAGTYLRDYGTATNSLLTEETGRADAATRDLSHVVLASDQPLTPQGAETTDVKIYESTGGDVHLVSVDAAGSRLSGASVVGGPRVAQGDADAISADGRHIFFTNPTGACGFLCTVGPNSKIYRRSDGTTTTLVSPSKRTPVDPLGAKGKTYEDASADGDRVFFTSPEQLTDDANTGPTRSGNDLYRYEVSTDTLIDVSAETNTANGARVQGILGASEDGEWIYYVALGQPIAGQGAEGKRNVYLWHDDGSADGVARFVTTLGDGVEDTTSFLDQGNGVLRRSYVSADGMTSVFQSAESLAGAPTNGHSQIYVYEAGSGNAAGTLSCASCRPDGSPSQGEARVSTASLSTGQTGGPLGVDGNPGRALSEDGSRLFFHSSDALLPGDQNDAKDVYLWEEGRLSLVSTGTSSSHSFFVGMSASGDDAFFFTSQALVGKDYGDGYDIYDARIGGGLASQNQPPPGEPCQADECKPAIESQPAYEAPKSAPQGEGNYAFPFQVAKLGASQRRALASGGRAMIGIRTDQAGQVVVRAVKGKRVLGSGSKLLLAPGSAQVALKLRPFATQMLKEKGRLSFQVQVSFAGEREEIEMTLRAPSQRKGGAK